MFSRPKILFLVSLLFVALLNSIPTYLLNFKFFIILYINDLPSVVRYCMLHLYADDAELYCSHSDLHVVETYLQSDLDSVATWLHSSH